MSDFPIYMSDLKEKVQDDLKFFLNVIELDKEPIITLSDDDE